MSPPPAHIRVMLVEDHEMIRSGINKLLEPVHDITIVGTHRTAEEAINELGSKRPDVVVLDHQLPAMTGAEACKHIIHRMPRAGVVFLTGYSSDEILHACLAAGGQGYVLKDAGSDDLIRAIRAVAAGRSFLSPAVTRQVIRWASTARTWHKKAGALTHREIEILSLVGQSLSNKEIAERLSISIATVKFHLSQAMKKLGARRRWDAVAAALERGVI